MLEGLNAIDWSKVEHAYGPATDVPFMIRALASDDAEERESALHGAYGNIFHQGTRYTATPKAIPFLVEIASQPKAKQRSELLGLLVHCVAGYLTSVSGPATRPMADYGETREILEACELAAEPAVPLCLRLLGDGDPRARASAAWLLAALRRFSDRHEVLPRVRDHFEKETEPSVRAMLAFALGHLTPPKDDGVKGIFERDPDALVRTVAAMACVRRREATPEVAEALVSWLDDAELDGRYRRLPCRADDLAGDIGRLLAELGPTVLANALPKLVARLSTVRDFGAVGILQAALAATFGEAKGPKDAAELSTDQRKLLETLAHNQAFWTIGNALSVLMERDLPSMRETMAEYLGVDVKEDPLEAARTAARMFEPFGPERELLAWMEMLEKHDDFEALARAGMLCVHLGHNPQAVQLLELALKKEDTRHAMWGEAVFAFCDALAALQRWDEALAMYMRAEPFLGEEGKELALQNRIAVLQRLGRAEEALALQLERTREPEDAMGFYRLGLAQVKAGKWRECIASIEKSLELDPDHANSHYTIACAHALLGDSDRALAAIARALEIEPDLAPDLAQDTDFASLQADPRFHALVGDE